MVHPPVFPSKILMEKWLPSIAHEIVKFEPHAGLEHQNTSYLPNNVPQIVLDCKLDMFLLLAPGQVSAVWSEFHIHKLHPNHSNQNWGPKIKS